VFTDIPYIYSAIQIMDKKEDMPKWASDMEERVNTRMTDNFAQINNRLSKLEQSVYDLKTTTETLVTNVRLCTVDPGGPNY
jgi:hypothetical protein